MDPLAFVASLVSSLAWPAVIVILVLAFRDQIQRMMARLPKRVRAGPLELEWPELATDARVALATSAEVRLLTPGGSLTGRLTKIAESEPPAAIVTAWSEVEKALRERLGDLAVRHPSIGGTMLRRLAREQGQISEETFAAMGVMLQLRNIAAHRPDEIDTQRALDYLTLADATLIALRTTTPNP